MISPVHQPFRTAVTRRKPRRGLIYATCALPLGLAACQVPGEGLKPPPTFPRSLPAEAELAPFQASGETLASQTDSLADFLQYAGSDTVTFEPRSADLNQAARDVLARQASWLAARPRVPVVIEGHSDERVTVPEAFTLSEQRANAVRRFLTANGIDSARIRLAAFGRLLPRSATRSEAGWQENRRARTLPILEPVRENRP